MVMPSSDRFETIVLGLLKASYVGIGLFALWFAWTLFGPGWPLSKAEIEAKMSSVDLQPYDRATYPKTFARLGESVVLGELQDVRRAGAEQAASDRRCDRVSMSDFSENESVPGKVAVFVDCENGFRIWFNRDGAIRTARY